jgi:hypothetical protein
VEGAGEDRVVSHAVVDGTLVLNSHFLGSDCTDADSLHASDCTVRMTVILIPLSHAAAPRRLLRSSIFLLEKKAG